MNRGLAVRLQLFWFTSTALKKALKPVVCYPLSTNPMEILVAEEQNMSSEAGGDQNQS